MKVTRRRAAQVQDVEDASGVVRKQLATDTSAVVAAAVADHYRVSVPYQGQQTNWWCGPASARMILNFMGHTVSAANSASPFTQAELASSRYLRTDSNSPKATNWGAGDYPRGFNKWYNRGATPKFITQVNTPTLDKFKGALAAKIPANQPFAIGTFEPAGSPHYNGHPVSQPVYHWIVVDGWKDNRATTYFRDPASTVWAGTDPTGIHSTSAMVNYMKPSFGMAL